ncbi:MAG: single-stranded-DNA-specific exonuclease RecJ [Thermomicrobium sp.]|nr:single-stranded-DNA-specific exonuclease RecJ [Thermomicrobium sp.]MDW8058547.1 single-stranded-DNA-specific exonuclease RecJ [Thermomicrobium sp.]
MPRYRWREPEPVPDWALSLAEHPLVAALLYRRGIRDRETARSFLSPNLRDVPSPDGLPELSRAVALVEQVRTSPRPVVVFGDYDVDGLTATTLLVEAFRLLGLRVVPIVPHRLRDGYGFREQHVPYVIDARPSLLVTVDCGTGDWDALAAVQRAGIPVIVLDHHDVHRFDWPSELVFVSAKRPDAPEAFRTLAAVGVAYQFARALVGETSAERWLPLVALGTVADVVPLVGQNRVFVALGLQRFWQDAPLGLRILALEAGLRPESQRALSAWHCGYVLGPRLNAAGRMDDPRFALELLLTDEPARARELAERLSRLNAERQRAIETMLQEAEQRLRARGTLPPVLVLADEAWHVGLVGLAASKLVGRYARPVVLLSREAEVSRGSARSVDGFDISAALERCRDLLLDHGGHSAAAGLTLPTDRIAELEARLLDLAWSVFGADGPALPLDLDLELRPYQVSLETASLLACLEPFGHGNPVPRCVLRNVQPVNPVRTQDGKHLRFTVVARDGTVRPAVWFDGGAELERVRGSTRIDVAFTLRRNVWNGTEQIELDVIDIRPAQR